ncbi:hypothetical protein CK203_078940 [Vitis vinifera]|uniref:CCHC-type domain-containing protein n=1 Tax=Vitis vinifera TaxID=29760 RepID=A0A438D9W5_VITVI|nr:hypothetical protein CK203_078940 [Vitis vinifera]
MKETETIVEMITRFTEIVNGLEALGRVINESEKVMKILRFSPQSGIQSLTKQLQESEDKKKKSIALKATTKEEEDVEEEKPSEEDDDLALITRKLNKYMRGERFRGKKFTSRRNPSRRESSSHGDKEKWEEKRDLICFKCKKPGHIKYDCPLYKIEAKRRMKKAMMATWSESEESSEEEKEKEVANMCFMAIDDLDEGSKEDKWFLDSGCSRHMTGMNPSLPSLQREKEDMSPLRQCKRKNHWSRRVHPCHFDESNNSLQERESFDDDLGLETSMRKLQIEDKRQQEESGEDLKKEESPLALPPPQQVQGESSQDLPKDWKFVINHPQDQIIGNPSSGDLLKRFNMKEAKVMKTPMSSSIKLDMDEKGKSIDSTMYRGMIGSLLYLTASRPDIMYRVIILNDCFSDAHFAGCRVERRSTSDTCHFLGHSLVSWP